ASFGQQRLWFLDQLEPGGALYNLPAAIRLRGELDVAALERALAEIVARHEALRTVFAADGEEVVQVIARHAGLALAVEPVTDEEEARQRVREEALRPFDLARGPLFRAFLFRMAANDHVLLLVMHHVVSDGWSMGVLNRELSALYAAFARGEGSPLAPLAVQYPDYAVWQREHLAGGEMERQLAWWTERLAGAPALLELPTDRPRAAVQDHAGASEQVMLQAELAQAIHALSRREGATLFMTLLAAWQLLLARCSGQEDVVVGSAIAGRNAAETDGLIGFFVNTLALRTDVSGDPTFRALLGRVRESTLGAYARQDLPFEKLVEEVRPERSLTHSPVFQAFFTLLNDGGSALPELPAVRAEQFAIGGAAAKHDLALSAVEEPEGLVLHLTYRTALFDAATIRRLLDQLTLLLRAAAADPDQRVSALPLLADEERARIAEWQHGPALPAVVESFPAQFAATAAAMPGAGAVEHAGERLTYAELDARSNQLAHHLRRLGIGPEARVGVCLERTPELIVSLLAVLKAGAAYVSLEPHFPAERIASVLRDADAALLIARGSTASIDLPCPALLLDHPEVRETIAGEADSPLSIDIDPDTLAHVIYTS
ncbi:MAG TPA: condensation domain-containing protein, partial [Longimicrobiaceae bacterium]|nr:condensation domain-containing protein [Longimicrobiaceae bacterium]